MIGNALKYNRDHRPVVVTVQQADTWAVVNVADRGVGYAARVGLVPLNQLGEASVG
jgi:signal transduction histidine kinase